MFAGYSGTPFSNRAFNRWQARLMRALNALLLNGAPFLPGKTSADPAKLTPPPRRSRTPLRVGDSGGSAGYD